jgi:hypothetical protein
MLEFRPKTCICIVIPGVGAQHKTPQRGRSLSNVDEDLGLLIYDAMYVGEPIPVVVPYKAWLWSSKPAEAWVSFVSVVCSRVEASALG